MGVSLSTLHLHLEQNLCARLLRFVYTLNPSDEVSLGPQVTGAARERRAKLNTLVLGERSASNLRSALLDAGEEMRADAEEPPEEMPLELYFKAASK